MGGRREWCRAASLRPLCLCALWDLRRFCGFQQVLGYPTTQEDSMRFCGFHEILWYPTTLTAPPPACSTTPTPSTSTLTAQSSSTGPRRACLVFFVFSFLCLLTLHPVPQHDGCSHCTGRAKVSLLVCVRSLQPVPQHEACSHTLSHRPADQCLALARTELLGGCMRLPGCGGGRMLEAGDRLHCKQGRAQRRLGPRRRGLPLHCQLLLGASWGQ